MSTTPLRRCRVYLDGLLTDSGVAKVAARDDAGLTEDDYQQFDAYTTGEHWNGWACPQFTREQADRLVAALEADNDEFKRSHPGNAGQWIVPTYQAEDDEYLEPPSLHNDGIAVAYPGRDIPTVDGTKRLYPVGAWAWTWDEIEPADASSPEEGSR